MDSELIIYYYLLQKVNATSIENINEVYSDIKKYLPLLVDSKFELAKYFGRYTIDLLNTQKYSKISNKIIRYCNKFI